MQHKGTVLLETDRLLLRRFRLEDADAAFQNWTSDEAVTKFLRWPTHKDIATTKRIITEWISNYKNEETYQWAIVLKDKNELIGTISVVDKNEDLDIVHIGYCIGSRWWNQGYTSETLASIISFFIKEVGVNRIESWHDPENLNSGKVMEKCGMKYEGTLRQADRSNRGIVDAAVYSILAEEYEL